MMPWGSVDSECPHDYHIGGPRAWRSQYQGGNLPARDFSDRVKKELETLRAIPCFKADDRPDEVRPAILYPKKSPKRAECCLESRHSYHL